MIGDCVPVKFTVKVTDVFSLAAAAVAGRTDLHAHGLGGAKGEGNRTGARGGQRRSSNHRGRARASGDAGLPRVRGADGRADRLGDLAHIDDVHLHAEDVAGKHVLERRRGNRHRRRGRASAVLQVEAGRAGGDGARLPRRSARVEIGVTHARGENRDRDPYRKRARGRQ